MCAKNNAVYTWREQTILEWSRRVNSIVACCHGAKLCTHAARVFRSQQHFSPPLASHQNGFIEGFSALCGRRSAQLLAKIRWVHLIYSPWWRKLQEYWNDCPNTHLQTEPNDLYIWTLLQVWFGLALLAML